MSQNKKNVSNSTIDIDPLTFFAIVAAVIFIPLFLAGFSG